MELYEAMRTTFAARDYTGESISDETLFRILDNARFAPSGGNRQGAHIILVRDAEVRDQLARLSEPGAKRYAAQMQAGESPWNAIHPSQVDTQTIAETSAPGVLTEPFRTADVVLVVCVDLGLVASMDQDLARVGVISGASIYPMVWNILLAARSEGFGGTITTLAVAQEPALQALLGIPSDYAVAALVPLGRPVKQLTRLKRQSVETFVSREKFDGERFTVK
jgi:nitroreductase